ncbi:MAG: SNF2-related protein, partial [Lachnospirales bacterium]
MNIQQAYYYATKLKDFRKEEGLIPIISSSNILVYPHQIASATFGLKRFIKFANFDDKKTGVLLCDEGGLGKTYTAMMIIATRYCLGDKILVVVPNQLIYEWLEVFENGFNVPYVLLKNKEQMQDFIYSHEDVILTTFSMVREYNDYFQDLDFDIVVVDEAHKLKSGRAESKLYDCIKEISKNSFKILLTATPIQNSILDIYHLAKLIDESLFDDEDSFYKRYYRREENYGKLSKKIRQIAFRTLRQEVSDYVNIPNRVTMSLEYEYSDEELKLYKLLESYLALYDKVAFPKMDKYDLTLMMTKVFSSSHLVFLNFLVNV